MNTQQTLLLKWRCHLIRLEPEVAPIFETREQLITLYVQDAYFAFDAADTFPLQSGYHLRIFVGKKLAFESPGARGFGRDR